MPLLQIIFTICIAALASLGLSWMAIRLGMRLGMADVPGGRRQHARTTSRLGALPLFGAFVIAVIFAQQFHIPTHDQANETRRLWGLLIGGAVIFVTGLLDDKWQLSPAPQFLMQAISAGIATASYIWIERFTNPFTRELVVLPDALGIAGYALVFALSLFWFIGMMNTVNWLDGVDGLCASVALVAAIVTMIHMLREQQYSVALLPAALIGTLLGFLVFNFQPAKIFIGGGALWLGFALACVGIIGGAKIALLLLVMGVPIADVAWQMIDRVRHGRAPTSADRGHLHLRLIDSGWSARRIVLLYVVPCALLGAIALVPQPPLLKLIAIAVVFGLVVAVLQSLSKKKV